MPQTSPWYSKEQDVYHDNTKCGPGEEIPMRHRIEGTGEKKHCKDCEVLNALGFSK